MADQRCALRLSRPPSQATLRLIRTRFDHVSARDADAAVLVVDDLDQAAVRALLILLWDTGHEVLSLTVETGDRHD